MALVTHSGVHTSQDGIAAAEMSWWLEGKSDTMHRNREELKHQDILC
jgi:hypothetical protein